MTEQAVIGITILCIILVLGGVSIGYHCGYNDAMDDNFPFR